MKFATIALLGAVSASNRRQRQMCPHHWGKDVDAECPNMNQAENMEDFVFARTIHKEWLEGALQGWYGQNGDMLPETCFGDWMDESSDNIVNVWTALGHGDIFGVSHKQVKGAVDDSIDMILRNINECQLYRPIYDAYHFCMTDTETCYQMQGFFGRVAADSFKLGTSAYDLYDLATVDDNCFTDADIIDEVKRGARDYFTLESAWRGFHGEWDVEAEVEKMSLPDMWHNMHNRYHDMLDEQKAEQGDAFKGGRCPVLGFFKDLAAGEVSIPWESFGMPALF